MIVSVIIPTYNRLEHLCSAVESVLEQSYSKTEIIVIDDGSTDATSEYITLNYPTVKVLTLPKNFGAAYARNKGIAISSGEIIAFLDSDDIWSVKYLESQIAFMKNNSQLSAVFSGHIKINEQNQKIRIHHQWPVKNPQHQLIIGESFIHSMSVFIIKRNAFIESGCLNESFFICHDREFYIRMLSKFKIDHNPHVLVIRNYSANQVTHNILLWYKEARMILKMVFEADSYYTLPDLKRRAYSYLNTTFFKRASDKKMFFLKLYCRLGMWRYC